MKIKFKYNGIFLKLFNTIQEINRIRNEVIKQNSDELTDLFFTEGFESTTFPPTGWLLQKSNTISATNTWSRLSNTTGLTAGRYCYC